MVLLMYKNRVVFVSLFKFYYCFFHFFMGFVIFFWLKISRKYEKIVFLIFILNFYKRKCLCKYVIIR